MSGYNKKKIKSSDQKFMKARIRNNEMLDYLCLRYNVDYFLFINQLDIIKTSSGNRATLQNDGKRMAKVHFTILDRNGNETYSGIESCRFSSHLDTPNRIGTVCFMKLSEIVVSSLPNPKRVKPEMSAQQL